MKYVSLFAGIGGFDLALNRLGHVCVWANEWDKYASQIYEKRIGKVDTRDIRTVNATDIPDAELLVGGFPCQAFSVAGKRGGFDDTRGTLFFEIARILKDKQPKFFILENVKGLLSHDSGNTFKTIISTLTGLGYDLQWQVLNSKNFGVPQNRERVFIVGNLRGQPRPKVFPIAKDDGVFSGENEAEQGRAQAEVSHTLKGSNIKADNAFIVHNIYGGFGEDTNREFHDIAPTVRTPAGGGHIPSVVQRVPLKFLNRNQRNIEGDYSYTIDGLNTGGVKTGMRIRRLTPVECERLQGFPDDFTKWGTDWKNQIVQISDTQRYKCLGNAVTVNVVYEIAKRMGNV